MLNDFGVVLVYFGSHGPQPELGDILAFWESVPGELYLELGMGVVPRGQVEGRVEGRAPRPRGSQGDL